ncbi:MAG TPA: Rpn family recombination-promoting nuclease/putative transposase [Candidatus Rhabdochlamydia sp.]|jgi:predicted transposase/invertase (TIGR01784 family)|nr:Rpn family recombination-promoting nuclease/putative transposase [Candidatus Rhabdochlamydia sp.]
MYGTFRLSKYLSPKNSMGLYKLFGVQENIDILMHFLNDVFFSKNPFISVELLPTFCQSRASVIDALCIDKNGTKYIIEIQIIKKFDSFEIWAPRYVSEAYSNQVSVEDKRYNVKEIIYIAIVADYEIFPNRSEYKWDHVTPEKSEYDLKNFFFNFIELSKFKKNKEELSSTAEKWCYFFKHAHETTEADLEKVIGKDDIFRRAYAALDQYHWTENEVMNYDRHTRIDMDHRAIMEQKFDEGRAIGLREVFEENKSEGDTDIELAKLLLKHRIGADIIAQHTNLSNKQIEDLKRGIAAA